jgi:hypothetical protein
MPMDLNDPFGRLRSRDQAAYEALRGRLAEAGITEPQAIDAVRRRAGRNTAVFLVVTLAVVPILCLLAPGLTPIIVATGAVAVAMAIKAGLDGRRLLARLAREARGTPTPEG